MTIHDRIRPGTPGGLTSHAQEESVEQHSLPQSLALHLLPGIVIATIFYGASPLIMRAGFPAIAAGMLAAAVGILGLELAWLLYQARRRTGRLALSAVLPYRPSAFTWRKGMLVLGLWVWGLGMSVLLADLKTGILENVFSWIPTWAVSPMPRDIASTSTGTVLVVTGMGLLVVNVILGPLTEELYFRGYLLPRLSRWGAWAPLINVSLFASYHLWKPWDVLTLIVMLAPMVYAVWRTHDIRIGIAVHIGFNGTGFLTNSLPTLLAG
ncbi:MAG TPA: type II CAAX endopeptidase family protein [Propionibacteriaceae bacterium]|nr:type II CAAX endopeptidase family protein [Propionibacteriaceae bacterium]